MHFCGVGGSDVRASIARPPADLRVLVRRNAASRQCETDIGNHSTAIGGSEPIDWNVNCTSGCVTDIRTLPGRSDLSIISLDRTQNAVDAVTVHLPPARKKKKKKSNCLRIEQLHDGEACGELMRGS